MMLAKISTELAEKKKQKQKKNTIGLRRTNDFESGPKICMNFQRQFYNNHLFVTVSLILILHLMFTSRFFNIGNPKWTPGMKKKEGLYMKQDLDIRSRLSVKTTQYISPRPWHIVKSSWTVFVLHISHPWNFDKLSLLLLFFFFVKSKCLSSAISYYKEVFMPLFHFKITPFFHLGWPSHISH